MTKTKKRGKIILSLLFRLAGTFILLVTIVVTASVVVPQFLGYQVCHIVSGSMEPEIPIGSMVYVKTDYPPEDVKAKEIIAFESGGSLVVHRVVRNQTVEGYFNTKGDANDQEDFTEVFYDRYAGKVVRHFPYVGQVMMIFTSIPGKIAVLCFAACGFLLNMVAGKLSRE